jgi:hypothetical protein
MESVAPPVDGALARALEAGRERYNALFAQARHLRPRLDPEAFAHHLRRVVAPIVARAAEVNALTETLYDLSIELMGSDLLRVPAIHRIWVDMLPRLSPSLDGSCRRLIASLCNAVHNMSTVNGVDVDGWVDAMIALAVRLPRVEVLLAAGQALAWTKGMAHYREGALDALKSLPPRMAAEILGTEEVEAAVERFRGDRWSTAGPAGLRVVARIGAFRGFGGLFLRPPRVLAVDDDLYVTDGTDFWWVCADTFGATFHRCEEPGPAREDGGPGRLSDDGTVRWDGEEARMPLLAGALSHAWTSDTLAVSLPLSHHVYLVARCR